MLGQALELEYGADLTIGPALSEGFYYDCFLGERTLGDADRARLNERLNAIVREKQAYERIEVSQQEARSMFSENKFKLEIIDGLAADAVITAYRVGPMVDLCTGPHVPHTGMLKAVAVTSASRAHWRADVTREPLQRVYGITFPEDKALKEWQRVQEEAKKRDHRTLGSEHGLFFFHELSPGSCFVQPAGARVYNALVEAMRDKYWEYGFQEVVTPNIYNCDLFGVSGHLDHYRPHMFCFPVEKAEFGLKPMNCPGHCLMFAHGSRSYRELPLRLADFGVLHRNEFSGALSGLTRVRRFQQDDGHIFCRADQIASEMEASLRMLGEVYTMLGLDYRLKLSTRPEDFMGSPELWDQAEAALRRALEATGRDWELNEGDGAFYGPKIDIAVLDALRRPHQCGTIQLDFQLPIKFQLHYVAEDNSHQRPVIVHRAVLGSVERMLAILIESYAGKFPLWLSPRQVCIVPVSEAFVPYAQEVQRRFRAKKFYAEADQGGASVNKLVRTAQLAQFNYIFVVGEKEVAGGTVNVRTRDNAVHGAHAVEDVLAALCAERDQRAFGSLFGDLCKPKQEEQA